VNGRPFATLIAFLVIAAAGSLTVNAIVSVRKQIEVAEFCDAVRAGRPDAALLRTQELLTPDANGLMVAECRCEALVAVGRSAECVSLFDDLLSRSGIDSWRAEPRRASQVARLRLDTGRPVEALELVRHTAVAHPFDHELFDLELQARSAVEGERRALSQIERSLDDSPASLRHRVGLAMQRRRLADHTGVLNALGDSLPPREHPMLAPWFVERASALAALERLADVQQMYRDWQAQGGDPLEMRARYALRISRSGLYDPEEPWPELLSATIAEQERVGRRPFQKELYERLIAHLLVDGRREEALHAYDRAAGSHQLDAITREQIQRGGALEPNDASGQRVGALEFHLPSETEGMSLQVSAHGTMPADAAYEAFSLQTESLEPGTARSAARAGAAGLQTGFRVRVERRRGPWPDRWVLVDEAGLARASGTAWVIPGETVQIDVAVGSPAPKGEGAPPPEIAAADGRRRVFTVVLDCGDWRLVQYLRTRGELPVLDRWLLTGHRAVLTSDPPLTAAAMEALVWPERGDTPSTLGVIHRMGLELAGLASVGENPLDFLGAMLPEGETLFEVVGAGDLVAANMLFAHGGIRGGRHAEVVGPAGRRDTAAAASAYRSLDEAERARFPTLVEDTRVRGRVEGIASELDAAVDLARAGEIDLLMIRLESLDILTHAFYSELTKQRQDDGEGVLLDVYRYIDSRLPQLRAALDADDVLIVMSDHGIKSPMEHAEDALFVAVGEGVPQGRAPGAPALAGVPRVLASLLGIERDWPDSGVAPFATTGTSMASAEPRASRAGDAALP
jgi:hypothetical protein